MFEVDDIANAIRYAVDNGADVISMSFGGPSSNTIEQAIHNNTSSTVLISAAGNSATDKESYPAAYLGVIAVAATAGDDTKAYYSNYGWWVDVAAPGGDQYKDNMIISTVPKTGILSDPSGYKALQGTSMACPYVAGVAGLIISQHPQYNIFDIYRQIIGTGDFTNFQNDIGRRTDVYDALTQISFLSPRIQFVDFRINDNGAGQSIGNGNGVVEQGETIELFVTLKNMAKYFAVEATNVNGVLSTNDPDIIIQRNSAYFGNIAFTSEVSSPTPFVFKVSATREDFKPGLFSLDITFNEPPNHKTLTFELRPNLRIEAISTGYRVMLIDPDIYENRVVWLQTQDGLNYNIQMYDLLEKKQLPITTYTSTNGHRAMFPVIYDDKIVWQESRNGNWDIYMFDLSLNQEIQITTDPSAQKYPVIYKDKIAWLDRRNGINSIYMYPLPSGPEICISSSASIWEEPIDIYENKIIWWVLDKDQKSYKLDMYDILSHKIIEIPITNCQPVGWRKPKIYKDKIIWRAQSKLYSFDTGVFMYNLTTGEEIAITNPDYIVYSWPDIYEDKIVYDRWEEKNGNRNLDIYLYDLLSRKETRITSDSSVHEMPSFHNNRVVWEQRDDNGNRGIYMATLYYPYNAKFISQSVPTTMEPGKIYPVSITFKNTGSSSWAGTGNYKLGSQNPMNNPIWGLSRVNLSATEVIQPGQTKTFNFNVIAPTTAGYYNFQWQMLQENVRWFGDLSPNVRILVNNPPQAVSVSPSSGSAVTNQALNFTTVYYDPDGITNLQGCLLFITSTGDNQGFFYGYYNQNTNLIYISDGLTYSWTANWIGGFAPGSANIIKNAYVQLDCSKTTVSFVPGANLVINWNLTFLNNTGSSKARGIYLLVTDDFNPSITAAVISYKGSYTIYPDTIIQPATSTSSRSNSWTVAGTELKTLYDQEWLEYTLNVPIAGIWNFGLTVKNLLSNIPAGYNFKIQIYVDSVYKGYFYVKGSYVSYLSGGLDVNLFYAGTHRVKYIWARDPYAMGQYPQVKEMFLKKK